MPVCLAHRAVKRRQSRSGAKAQGLRAKRGPNEASKREEKAVSSERSHEDLTTSETRPCAFDIISACRIVAVIGAELGEWESWSGTEPSPGRRRTTSHTRQAGSLARVPPPFLSRVRTLPPHPNRRRRQLGKSRGDTGDLHLEDSKRRHWNTWPSLDMGISTTGTC
jgi:hypothetical protein